MNIGEFLSCGNRKGVFESWNDEEENVFLGLRAESEFVEDSGDMFFFGFEWG